jgi:diguanylate cyclase (GGDEF)-like protein/PAS domain S-box-containing protein
MVSNVTAAESETTLGMSSDATPLSRAALQRHEEAVFEIAGDGAFTPLNSLAAQLDKRLAPYDRAKIAGLAKAAVDQERAIVDLVDVGEGQYIQHLQMTLVPVSGRSSAFCFVRDLTLDYSLRRTLVDSRRRYRDFVEISSDFTWETGADSKFAYVTPHGALGYSADNLLALHPDDLIAPESRGDNPFLTRERLEHHEVWLHHRDGQAACMVVSALPLIDAEGVWRGARGVCRDVSELREREAALVRVNNRERVLTRIVRAFRDEVNPEAMLAVAAEVLAKGLGADFSQVFRATPQPSTTAIDGKNEYLLAAKYGEVIPPDASDILTLFSGGAGAAEILRESWQVLAAPARFQGATNGVVVLWRSITRGPWSDDDRLLIADIANQIGVTIEQLEHHEHILRISRTDALTGLLNRGAFLETLTRHLSRLRPDTGPSVLMYVDLDNFKQVNDVRGHQAGDELLSKVRDILIQSTRPTDVVARLGGDEFAIWLVSADQAAGEMRGRQILERSKALAAYSGSPTKPVGMSIGVAVWQPQANESMDQLMARADAAMYQAKRGGKGHFVVAEPAEAKS